MRARPKPMALVTAALVVLSAGPCLAQAGNREVLYLAVFDLSKLRAARAKSIHGNA